MSGPFVTPKAKVTPARISPAVWPLMRAPRSPKGATPPKPLKPEDLPLDGKQTFSWPMDPETGTVRDGSRLNKVLLLRLDPEGFDPETKEHAAEGVVAYFAVCAHRLRRH